MKSFLLCLICFGLFIIQGCKKDEVETDTDESNNDNTTNTIVLDCGGSLLTDHWWISQSSNLTDVYFNSDGTAKTGNSTVGYVDNTWTCANDSNRIEMFGVTYPGYDAEFTITSINDSILKAKISQTGGSASGTWKKAD